MAAKKRTRERPGKHKPKTPSDPEVAEILAYADKETNAAAAEKFGVSDRTIRRWKSRVESGKWPAMADLVRQLKTAAIERCKDLLADVYETSLRLLKDKMPTATYRELLETVVETGGLKQMRDESDEFGVEAPGQNGRSQTGASPAREASGGAGPEKALRIVG